MMQTPAQIIRAVMCDNRRLKALFKHCRTKKYNETDSWLSQTSTTDGVANCLPIVSKVRNDLLAFSALFGSDSWRDRHENQEREMKWLAENQTQVTAVRTWGADFL